MIAEAGDGWKKGSKQFWFECSFLRTFRTEKKLYVLSYKLLNWKMVWQVHTARPCYTIIIGIPKSILSSRYPYWFMLQHRKQNHIARPCCSAYHYKVVHYKVPVIILPHFFRYSWSFWGILEEILRYIHQNQNTTDFHHF